MIARQHNEVANTNIEAVFDLILSTAIKNHMVQEDIPANILIVSDMEFDSCATSGEAPSRNSWGWYSSSRVRPTTTLFDAIAKKYAAYGYKLPRLVFWNICGRTQAIPLQKNDNGVILMSGFTPNQVKMLMSDELDPYKLLVEVLKSKRYEKIELF
jgi:hypothetical protein